MLLSRPLTSPQGSADLAAVIDQWCRSIVAKDLVTAEALRDDGYRVMLPGGQISSKAEELRMIASPEYRCESFGTENLHIEQSGDGALAFFDAVIEGEFGGRQETIRHPTRMTFRNRNGAWKVVEWHLSDWNAPPPQPPRRTLGAIVRRWIRGREPVPPSFEKLAWIPHRAGEDFSLPNTAGRTYEPEAPLPVPPRELWLGYNYLNHGKTHVDRMLDIARTSGFDFRPGDRILDFGCGAGRMIRHLQPLAETCEIWGTDISASHILWCKRNLSPPFHFATTTKVPHLPFEDRSFRFIYCGSVFTHIDDLADAWLLEMRRILAPGGRLYATIHDNHTMSLLEKGEGKWLGWLREKPVYQQSKESFDMFTVGRGADSQVFYDQAYFRKMVGDAFEVVSVTPEAYFYQTAFLLERR